ncbi:MAG: hypothetical protein QM736_18300 [Vicinamibacterales bacterium]
MRSARRTRSRESIQSPGSARARALLRDTRWNTPQAGDVPIARAPPAIATAWHLVRLRLHRAAGLVARRWVSESAGGAMAGALGGVAGGLLLLLSDHASRVAVIPVLAAIGMVCGGLAGAGVGAGLPSPSRCSVRGESRAPWSAVPSAAG